MLPPGSQCQQIRPKPKSPALYDGKNSCRDYLVQFEMVSDLNRWNANTRALELAQGVLSDLEAADRANYPTAVVAFITQQLWWSPSPNMLWWPPSPNMLWWPPSPNMLWWPPSPNSCGGLHHPACCGGLHHPTAVVASITQHAVPL